MRTKFVETVRDTFYSSLPLAVIIIACLLFAPLPSPSDYYKIIVEPNNTVGDLNKTGTVKYKKHTSQYWETLNSLEILIDELGDYDILYEDINNNSFSETIKVCIEDDILKIPVYNYS